ncbi:MAG: hypothetical protein ACI38A_04690 [Candidatus Ornithomonoglobus sp.]
MRERLIELILKSDILCDTCGENSSLFCIEALADYLLANGVIVPPCKLGDGIYITVKDTIPYVTNELVERFFITNKVQYVKCYSGAIYLFRDFGKTIFLTREEAERALKEAHNDQS